MSSKSPILVLFVASVCGILTWIIGVHLLSEAELPGIMLGSIGLGFTIWLCVILGGLIGGDTFRRRGTWGINFERVVCPRCGTHMRSGISRRSLIEHLLGDWTCHECGLELSQWGRPLKKQNTLAKWTVLQAVGEIEERRQRSQTREDRILNVNDQTQRGDAS